jgi:hypothetical protein
VLRSELPTWFGFVTSKGEKQMAQALRIVSACIDAPNKDKPEGSKTAEFVQLQWNGESITGYKTWHTVDPNTPKQRLEVYHAFTSEPPTGTKYITIHSGTGQPFLEDKVWHMFADGPTGHGRWRLNNTGEHIVVTDTAGNTIDEKRFPAKYCASPLKVAAVAVAVGAAGSTAAAFGPIN